MKILFFDIETLPGAWLAFQAKTEWLNPKFMLHPPFMLSWAARWGGEKRMHSEILTPAEVEAQDDSRIVANLAALFEEADYVVAHNADRFDIPMLNGFVATNSLPPLRRVQSIDTLKIAKGSLRQVYNSLDELAKALGVPNKIKTDGDLWRDCYFGDELALRKMLRYNRQDVVVLEGVYDRLIPYAKTLPRLVDPEYGGQLACDRCASESVRRDGIYRTPVNSYQRRRCNDCGHCWRDSKALKELRAGGMRLAA